MTRTSRKRTVGLALAMLTLAALSPALLRTAEAGYYGHGYRHGYGHGFGYGRGYGYSHGYGHGYGYGYGYGYRPQGGLTLDIAKQAGLGAVDLNVKPKKAEVYVDGEYAGLVRNFDGYPAYLWLSEGVHQVVLFHNGRKTEAREFTVRKGEVIDFHLRMQDGEAVAAQELFEGATALG